MERYADKADRRMSCLGKCLHCLPYAMGHLVRIASSGKMILRFPRPDEKAPGRSRQ